MRKEAARGIWPPWRACEKEREKEREREREKESQMCPACIASAAIIAVSTESGGGFAAFVGKELAAIFHEAPGIFRESSRANSGQALMSSQLILTSAVPKEEESV
jgi:hypothetical protein